MPAPDPLPSVCLAVFSSLDGRWLAAAACERALAARHLGAGSDLDLSLGLARTAAPLLLGPAAAPGQPCLFLPHGLDRGRLCAPLLCLVPPPLDQAPPPTGRGWPWGFCWAQESLGPRDVSGPADPRACLRRAMDEALALAERSAIGHAAHGAAARGRRIARDGL